MNTVDCDIIYNRIMVGISFNVQKKKKKCQNVTGWYKDMTVDVKVAVPNMKLSLRTPLNLHSNKCFHANLKEKKIVEMTIVLQDVLQIIRQYHMIMKDFSCRTQFTYLLMNECSIKQPI